MDFKQLNKALQNLGEQYDVLMSKVPSDKKHLIDDAIQRMNTATSKEDLGRIEAEELEKITVLERKEANNGN
tara:strand:+ start:10558 stop:10773 length:216 start_codon:yes stop_codon:yes gene_type:complete